MNKKNKNKQKVHSPIKYGNLLKDSITYKNKIINSVKIKSSYKHLGIYKSKKTFDFPKLNYVSPFKDINLFKSQTEKGTLNSKIKVINKNKKNQDTVYGSSTSTFFTKKKNINKKEEKKVIPKKYEEFINKIYGDFSSNNMNSNVDESSFLKPKFEETKHEEEIESLKSYLFNIKKIKPIKAKDIRLTKKKDFEISFSNIEEPSLLYESTIINDETVICNDTNEISLKDKNDIKKYTFIIHSHKK